MTVPGGIARQLSLLRPVGADEPDLAVPDERDRRPVRRPCRLPVGRVRRERVLAAPVRVHEVDALPAVLRGYRELGPIGRPGGRRVADPRSTPHWPLPSGFIEPMPVTSAKAIRPFAAGAGTT